MNYQEAEKYIAGIGTQLLSKRLDKYSSNYPYDYSSAKGIKILSNGKLYTDFSTMGVGSCILGYSNETVNNAVKTAINNGNMSSLNTELEIKLAKKLREYEPQKLFRYFKSGGEAMAAAVRIARAHTGKSIVLCNGYHGWHDWYLSSNFQDNKNHLNISTTKGVPEELKNTCYYFSTIEELKKLVNNNVAAIVIELARYKEINIEIIEYLKTVNIPVIVDEITTGWRAQLGGMWKNYEGFNPDIVVYGKAISNGYPFSVICIQENLNHAAKETFISSTYWTESIGMAAAYATIWKLENESYDKRNKFERLLKLNLKIKFGETDGFPGMIHYYPKDTNNWVSYMLENNYLVTDQLYLSFAHKENDINNFIDLLMRYK